MKLPRFSLRTIFIAIALLGIPMAWVTYQLNWIRDRHAAIDSQEENDLAIFVGPSYRSHSSIPALPAPWQLRIFGEPGAAGILVQNGGERPALIHKLKKLFPEATVVDVTDGKQRPTQ